VDDLEALMTEIDVRARKPIQYNQQ